MRRRLPIPPKTNPDLLSFLNSSNFPAHRPVPSGQAKREAEGRYPHKAEIEKAPPKLRPMSCRPLSSMPPIAPRAVAGILTFRFLVCAVDHRSEKTNRLQRVQANSAVTA